VALTETTILDGIRDVIVMESRGRCVPRLALDTKWTDLDLTESEREQTVRTLSRRFCVSADAVSISHGSVGHLVARIQAEMQI
jgi:hypothetical protein